MLSESWSGSRGTCKKGKLNPTFADVGMNAV